MSQSNHRSTKTNTIHHLVSRIAHKVYFLEQDDKNDFIEMMRRVAYFTGIKLLGWCIMSNHFHLLVYLPDKEFVDEDEVIRRYEALKGQSSANIIRAKIKNWRMSIPNGNSLINEWLDSQRNRMNRISEFMKILKQWFTGEYNRRHAHKGTLWESTYFDKIVNATYADMAKCLAYIHLNPIRAASASMFDEYIWSSYSAFHKDDEISAEGMRFVYGKDIPDGEISKRHENLMSVLLEEEKLRRAKSIARKVALGYKIERDPLTTEAEVAQATTRMKELENEMAAYHIQRDVAASATERYAILKAETLCVLKMHPEFSCAQLQEAVAVTRSVLYRILADLKKNGQLQSANRGHYIPLGQKV